MAYGFLDIAATPSVKAAQTANGSREMFERFAADRSFDRFTARETEFIATRDSFYMATVSETGWPYVQHRGGPAGFIHVLDDKTFAVADFRGNRQYISVGNLSAGSRAALIFMDYANRRRLKILTHVEIKTLDDDPELAAVVMPPGYRAKLERILLFHLDAFDWNCSQHITQRFTETEVMEAVSLVRARMAQLEVENASLRDQLAAQDHAVL